MSEDYVQQIKASQTVFDNPQAEQFELEKGVNPKNPFLAAFRKYENIDKLTRGILIEVVAYIEVYEGGGIGIRFKFADEYRRVTEYIEANTYAEAI